MRKFLFSFFSLCFLLPFFAHGQYGPMGIGNKDGSDGQPHLLLWLDASSVQTNSSNELIQWSDKSGNNFHFVPAGSQNPVFLPTGGPSGKAAVRFNGNDRIKTTNFPLSGNGYSIYIVYKSSDNKFGLFSYSTSAHPQEVVIHAENDKFYQKHRAVNQEVTDLGGPDANWSYLGIAWSRSNPKGWSKYNPRQQSEGTGLGSLTSAIPGTVGDAIIGDIQPGGSYDPEDAFEGEIAEVIVYKGSLTKGHTRLMRTYLWTKYGYNPEWNNSNKGWDKFKGFAAGSNAMYDKVIGIGKDQGNPVPGGQPESRLEGLVMRTYPDLNAYNNMAYICAGLVPDEGNEIVTTDLPAGVIARWSRVWEIAHNASNDQMLLSFDFGEGIDGDIPQKPENFVLLRRKNNTGPFQVANFIIEQYVYDDEVVFRVNQSNFKYNNNNKWFYTIGTKSPESTLDGSPLKTWYCRGTNQNTSLWSNPSMWTLDGSTNPVFLNPDNLTPQPGDNIVIPSGRAIKLDVDNLTDLGNIVINGVFNVATAGTPRFTSISGNGTIRCAGFEGEGNFPLGNTSAFADPITGGTVEFYSTSTGGGYTQSTPLSTDVILVNNLIINMNQIHHEIVLTANLTHNGTFDVSKGTLVINDDSPTSRTIISNGRVAISSNGIVKVSDAASPGSGPNTTGKHRWFFDDDLINSGQLIFTNRLELDSALVESQHWVEAHFTNGIKNQTLTANGSVNRFSRIIVNKGHDQTYVLTINSNATNKFQLLGRHVATDNGDPEVPNIQDSKGDRNSCVIINGTLEVGKNIDIILHRRGGNYSVGRNAQIWVNGGSVTKDAGTAIVIYGKVRITAGELNANCNSGFTTRDNGILQVDGGVVNANQIRTSVYGTNMIGGIIINGGVTTVNGKAPGQSNSDFYTLSLTYPGNLFQMTGGILKVKGATSKGLIFINSDPQNTHVTGGTIIAEVSTNDNNYRITSRAAFWNLQLERSISTGANRPFRIQGGSSGSGVDKATLTQHPLVVKGDLIISGDNNTILDTQDSGEYADVYVQGNFTIQNGATYNHYQNTTYFDGLSNSDLKLPTDATQSFYNVVINKNSDTRYARVAAGNGTRAVEILGMLEVRNGFFDNRDLHLSIKGDIINRSFIGNPNGSSMGTVYMESSVSQEITSYNAVFHNLAINNSEDVFLRNGNLTIRRALTLTNGNFYIGEYKIRIEGQYGSLGGTSFGSNKCIVTNGKPSAGGLELVYRNASQNSVFPIGVKNEGSVKYTPAQIKINSGYIEPGFIRVVPVDTLLLTAQISAGEPYLNYYWRVIESEFDVKPMVSMMFEYNDSDVIGNEDSLAAGRVLTGFPFERSVDSLTVHNDHVNKALNRIFYNGLTDGANMNGLGTKLVNADYSAGNRLRFEGKPKVFYSRSTQFDANWEDPANWNEWDGLENDPFVLHSEEYNPASSFPQNGDIAFIGFDPTTGRPHIYKAPSTGITASRINFTQLQDAMGNPLPRYYDNSGNSVKQVITLRPGVNFSATAELDKVQEISGEGTIILTSNNIDITKTDIGGFLAKDSSIIILQGVTNISTLPSDIPNLFIVSPTPSSTVINSNLKIRGNLEIIGGTRLDLSSGNSGDIIVNGDLIFERYQLTTSSPALRYQYAGVARKVEVKGDVFINGSGAGILVFSPNAIMQELTHEFIAWKNIYQNSAGAGGGLKFFSKTGTSPNNQKINLILKGQGNHEFNIVAGDLPSLNRVFVDKGHDLNSSFSFNSFIAVNAEPTLTEKPVELLNGKLILNHPNIDITLSALGNYFIPITAGLKLLDGKLRINGPETGLILAGSLEVENGLFEIGNTDGENNFIEYASVGNPKLYISGGKLSIGSLLRTNLTSGNGNLDYRQTGGEVILGNHSAPITVPMRPVFEIKGNAGSRFEHTGGTITFVRGLNHATGNSIVINPQYHNVGGNAKIVIGNENSPVGAQIKNFGISTHIALNKFFIDNSSGNGPQVRLASPGLTIKDSLKIDAGSTLISTGLPIDVYGDIHNEGKLNFNSHNNSILTLHHSSISSISGGGEFVLHNLVRTGGVSGITLVEADLEVGNNFTCDKGIMSFGHHYISVKRDVLLDGALKFDLGSTGLVMNGTVAQTLRRTGPGLSEIDVLTIDNLHSNGITMTSGAGFEFFISRELRMRNGVLSLQGNLISLGEGATITDLVPFSDLNMISTYGSNTNFGIKKYFPANFNEEFIIPIGVTTGGKKYTPVRFWFDDGDDTGSHPSSYVVTLTPDYHEIIDLPSRKDSVLSMYFTLEAETGTDVRMNVDFQYHQSFVPKTPLERDYISARVYGINSVNKFTGPEAVDDINNILSFRFNGVGKEAIDGDYFAGIETAIPGEIPIYNTMESGDVIAPIYDVGVPGGGAPNGAVVNINANHKVVFNDDNITFYQTFIDSDAILEINATDFHRLGRVKGTGTIKLNGTGSLPSGNYQDFFTCEGGKIIYEGRSGDDFQILANLPIVREVKIIGHQNSIISFANNNVSICENLIADGPTVFGTNNTIIEIMGNLVVNGGLFNQENADFIIHGDLEVKNDAQITAGNKGSTIIKRDLRIEGSSFGLGELTRNTEVKGDIIKTAGIISGGLGGATLTLNGNSLQHITGNFTASSKIPSIAIDNIHGVKTLDNIEISDTLKLISGHFHTSETGMIVLNNDQVDVVPEGGSKLSFINGPMQWVLSSNPSPAAPKNRIFPVGANERYRPVNLPHRSAGTWEVQYYDTIALIQDPDITSLEPENPFVETVSIQEHWKIKSINNGTAKVGLSWGENSAVSILLGDYQKLLVLEYNDNTELWESRGADISSFAYNANENQGSFIASETSQFSQKFFTLGSSDKINPLPVTWLYFTGTTRDKSHILSWATATEENNEYFVVQRSIDAQNWYEVQKVEGAGFSTEKMEYSWVDNHPPYGIVYYRIAQLDFDGELTLFHNIVSLELKPEVKNTKSEFVIFPNPTQSGMFKIKTTEFINTAVQMSIADLTGKVLKQKMIYIDNQGISETINANFRSGFYLVTLTQNDKTNSKPLIITE